MRLKDAITNEHLDRIRQKKARRPPNQNYMNYIDKVFPLEVILDK